MRSVPPPRQATPAPTSAPLRWGLLAAALGGGMAVMALAVVLVVLALPGKKQAKVVRADEKVAVTDTTPFPFPDAPDASKDRDKDPSPQKDDEKPPEQQKPEQKPPQQKPPEQKSPPRLKEPPQFNPTPRKDDTKRDTVNAILDSFGNPKDRSFSLARDDEFKGKRLLAYCNYSEIRRYMYEDTSPLWAALRKKGFEVTLKGDKFDPAWLETADQLWIFSSHLSGMDEKGYEAVEKFVNSGKGLYLLSDNNPYVAESSALVKRMYGGDVKDDYIGQKLAVVKERKLTQEQIAKYVKAAQTQGNNGAETTGHYLVDDHVLLTGLNFFWEGVTVSHVVTTSKLESAVLASDGKCLIAVSKVPKQRVVIDCGWTRYYPFCINNTAGTVRLAENVAAYLQRGDK